MTEPDCKLCGGERWICEEHPEQPMGHDECMGAGMPCPRAGQHHCEGSKPPSTASTAAVSKKAPPWGGASEAAARATARQAGLSG
jgi:hypothetical protein